MRCLPFCNIQFSPNTSETCSNHYMFILPFVSYAIFNCMDALCHIIFLKLLIEINQILSQIQKNSSCWRWPYLWSERMSCEEDTYRAIANTATRIRKCLIRSREISTIGKKQGGYTCLSVCVYERLCVWTKGYAVSASCCSSNYKKLSWNKAI